MPACEVGANWSLVTEDRDAVLAALKRGECDGIVPAAGEFMDGFAEYLHEHGVLGFFERFPDGRARRSIGPEFFCNTLLHKALFRLRSLAQIGPVLFHSTDVLRRLGFNLRQVRDGFYDGDGQRPFDPEALAEFFAALEPAQLQQHQRALAAQLVQQCPVLRETATAVLDANTVTVPPGSHTPGGQVKACVLGLRAAGRVLPLLWNFTLRGPGEDNDLTQGKQLIAVAREAFGDGVLRRLLVDRGFIDGAWISALKAAGIDTVIGLRSDMALYEDMIGLSRLDDARWLPASPPKLQDKGKRPQRALCSLADLQTWDACTAPLHGIVIRDTYPDRVEYQCLVTTDLDMTPHELHDNSRDRWDIEESFMDLTRYWGLNDLGACRIPVATAQIHFIFLAYTLLHLFDYELAQQGDGPLPTPVLLPGREITVYWRGHYMILLPSELIAIVLDNYSTWLQNRDQLLAALRFCEGLPPPTRLRLTPPPLARPPITPYRPNALQPCPTAQTAKPMLLPPPPPRLDVAGPLLYCSPSVTSLVRCPDCPRSA